MQKAIRGTLAVLIFTALYGIINAMGKSTPIIGEYILTSDKVGAPVRIAVVADLHNTRYGEKQSRLVSCVASASPDIVTIVGDAFHTHSAERHTIDALKALADAYPCYYVTGNHERSSGECAAMKETVRALGVTVLSGACETIEVNGQTVQLCGLDDFSSQDTDRLQTQLLQVSAHVRDELLCVLLVHRPERFSEYLPCGFDVILAGHAHGGQWRIPGARNGIFAPGQGWLPKYAGGLYTFGRQTMCVSRGLSNKPLWLARFGNPPEVLLVTVSPA